MNRFLQVFAIKNQIYVYKQRDLYDIVKTCESDKGVFSTATFRDDDDMLMLAVFSPTSKLSLVVKDYNSNQDLFLENIFGELPDVPFN